MAKPKLITSKPITKAEAIGLYGGAHGSQQRLATALGLSKQAVSDWPDGPIPEVHDMKLRYELMPEAFARPQAAHAAAKARA